MSYKSRLLTAAVLWIWSSHVHALIGASAEPPEAVQRAFPEVVRLQSGREVCTGTIVGPRAVLSAAHCADLKNTFFVYGGERYNVNFASSSEYKSKEHDVAVALTSRDIKAASFASIGSGLRHGSTLFLAGFGCTRRGGKSGLLHMGATKVIGMDEDHVLSFSKSGGVLCQGDSGGPAFLKDGDRRYVVAVNSAGDIRNINLNVRLDSPLSRAFLHRVVEKFRVVICGISSRCGRTAAEIARLDQD